MAIRITWEDRSTSPPTVSSFTMPDDLVSTVDQFRQGIVTMQPGGQLGPVYATVSALIVGVLVQQVILPALNRFPTAEIQTAHANLAAAQTALAAAQTAVIPGLNSAS